jgi:hypothetical protein
MFTPGGVFATSFNVGCAMIKLLIGIGSKEATASFSLFLSISLEKYVKRRFFMSWCFSIYHWWWR